MGISFFNFRKRKNEKIRKAATELAEAVVCTVVPLRECGSKFLAHSSLTQTDTAVFGCFLARTAIVSRRNREYIDEFDEFYLRAMRNYIFQYIPGAKHVDEIIDNRTMFYDHAYMRKGTVQAIADAFQSVILSDYTCEIYVPHIINEQIALHDFYDEIECNREVVTNITVLMEVIKPYVINAKKAIS